VNASKSESAALIEISPFTPAHRTTFAELWVPWLKSITGADPEPEDVAAVGDPESFYIARGGAVYFALMKGEPVGVVAVKKLSAGIFEFCKLVVIDEARGLGVGRRLVGECISFARSQGAELLTLQSFRRLVVALGMYERMGFEPMKAPPGMIVLSRTEIVMGMRLSSQATEKALR
jgi:GNAT superfamily N-acetyltransferase